MAGAVVVLLAGAAVFLVRPLRQAAKELYNSSQAQWSRSELAHMLDQYLGAGQVKMLPVQPAAGSVVAAATAGPLRVAGNRRYFADATGKVVYLAGAHTWSNFQNTGAPPITFDYTAYLDFLANHGLNFFRLWTWEQAKWGSWTATDIQFTPLPYLRPGPGTALDGQPKFNLNQFNESYFTRLRQRVIAARDRGVYVSVMLFDGWSIEDKQSGGQNPWRGHPFNGDLNGNGQGSEIHTNAISAVTALQQAYVRKVVDTVNDLDNVLYEISNESHTDSTQWQYDMINYVKSYELTKPYQHPVGMTAQWPNGDNNTLMNSPADWVSPNDGWGHGSNPPDSAGAKVIVADTDHIWGIGGDVPWVWKSLTRGVNTLFMDPYDCSPFWPPTSCTSSTWEPLRLNLGYARAYADRMNLLAATPRSNLCSTSFCLANPTAPGAEFLVYQPTAGSAFTVNLSGLSGSFSAEWLNPATGVKTAAAAVNGGAVRSFTPPFNGDAVLYLKQTGAPTNTPTRTPTPTPTKTPTPTATPKPALFPTSPLLDNFNRPNGGLGVNWQYQPISYGIANNRLSAPASGLSAWQPASFGSEQEAFVALTSLAPATREVGVLLKTVFDNSIPAAGIRVGYLPASGVVRVSINDTKSWRALAPDLPGTLAAGDRLGARAGLDGVIEVFRNGALLGSVNGGPTLAAAGGRIGVYVDYGTGSGVTLLDDFGGGSATFVPPPAYRVQISATVTGTGAVQVEPSGVITCGQRVTITAVPAAGWQFGGWTGDVVATSNPLIYDNLTGSLTLVANFIEQTAALPYTLTVQTVGEGTVSLQPAGPYAAGQVVQAAAQAAPGWLFTGWRGAAENSNNPLGVAIAGNTALTATFALARSAYLPTIQQAATDATDTVAGCE
jgi:hypothetical protein